MNAVRKWLASLIMAGKQSKPALNQIDSTKLNEIEGWKNLWDQGIFPWHKDSINPKLERFWELQLNSTGKKDPKKCRFFVPLCGKTKDMLFLHSKGFQVVGCEGVDKACTEFFTENKIPYESTKISQNLVKYATKDQQLQIFCGDYFELTPEVLGGKVDCVWDRGSLVAIPLEKRSEYAQVMVNLLQAQFGYLIASIERPKDPPGAMPHSLSYEDVNQLFGKEGVTVKLLESNPDENNVKDNTFLIIASNMANRLDMWQERWDKSMTGWHKSEVNPHLVQTWDFLLDGREKVKFLFPLSGKSLDLIHCYKLGHEVVGIEGVTSAIEEMFKDAGLAYSKTNCEEIEGAIYQTEDKRLTVFNCDFFKMKPELIGEGKCQAVFDRGSFEAIFEADREAYSKLILKMVAPDFRYVLNCYDYHGEFQGPPRSCKSDEVFRLYNGHDVEGKKTMTSVLSTEECTDYFVTRGWKVDEVIKFLYGIKCE